MRYNICSSSVWLTQVTAATQEEQPRFCPVSNLNMGSKPLRIFSACVLFCVSGEVTDTAVMLMGLEGG